MLLTGPTEAAAFAALDRLDPGGPLGLAVSGGSDSTALMLLAAAWARARGRALAVATVDHGLRPEGAAEAEAVAARAAALGLPHATLRWEGPKPAANLQAAARDARARLLADWAAERGLSAVALGHTLDDQAETVLLRLARGSGVDGLAGMAARSRRAGALWLRPLLGLRRAALRDWLATRGETWRDDPSNEDPRFDRTRARAALDALAALGIAAEGLAATAGRMARARAALEAETAALAAEAVRLGPIGDATLALAPLRAAPEEIALRLLADALRAVSGASYRPRFADLARLFEALAAEADFTRTLHGCVIARHGDALGVAREPAAAGGLDGDVWDARFHVARSAEGVVAALGEAGEAALRDAARGEGWTAPPDWRAAPRAARLATPALWRRDRLAAAPLAAYGSGLDARLLARPPGAR